MDDLKTFFSALALLTPVFSASACFILTRFSILNCFSLHERKLKRILLLYLSLTAAGWFTTFCYFFAPGLFVCLNVVCLASYIFVPVIFYRLIRFLLRFDREENFSFIHYLFPALLIAVLLVWSLFVPFDVQVTIVKNRLLSLANEYVAYSRLFTSKALFRMIFMLVYSLLVALLLVRYLHRAKDSGSRAHHPERWVLFVAGLLLAITLSSFVMLFTPRSRSMFSVWTVISSLCIVGQQILTTYHILRRQYIPYMTNIPNLQPNPQKAKTDDTINHAVYTKYSGVITREILETLFREKKPYLNPQFKIADLVTLLDVNRTAVSSFINKTYNMNFNQYLNHLRIEELNRLKTLPENRSKKTTELLKEAGFANMRGYFRVMEKK